jgi:hypothetical protein
MDDACDQARYGSNHSFARNPTGLRSGLADSINQQITRRATRHLTNAKLLLRGTSRTLLWDWLNTKEKVFTMGSVKTVAENDFAV